MADISLANAQVTIENISCGKLVESGTGSKKNFDLPSDFISIISVTVGDTAVGADEYTIEGGQIKFTTAPASGTDNIVILYNKDSFNALATLDGIDADVVFNTGLDAIDSGEALKLDEFPFVAKKIASIRLYRNNSYIFLAPGDKVTLTTTLSEETAYYLNMKGEFISVEVTAQ